MKKTNIIEKTMNTIMDGIKMYSTYTTSEIINCSLQEYVDDEALFHKRIGREVTIYDVHNSVQVVKLISSEGFVTIITYKLLQTIEE